MKYLYVTIILSLITLSGLIAQSQPGNFHVDTGILAGFYASETQINFEETVIIRPPAPGIIKKVFVFLGGTQAKKDTIWVVGDPADGTAFPPSIFCRYINSYGGFIVNYTGEQGWYEIDIEHLQLKTGGINAIGLQHLIKPGGPFFGVDTRPQNQNNLTSFLSDVFRPNPQFYNLRGTIVQLTAGSYMAGVLIEYDFTDDSGKPLPAPSPSLIDVTVEAGLVDKNNNPIKNAVASVADWNNDGYDDIAIAGGHFFQNNQDGTFKNISDLINVPNSGTIWADIDNDGNLDFFAVRGWGNDKIYFGNGDGTFTEDTDPTIVLDAPTVSPMFLDYDGDGLLDLFIAYGRREVSGTETYYPDQLFRNLGNRKFENVTVKSGIAAGEPAPYHDCWGASITDYNNDGLPDIFVATYRLAPDLLYRNNGNGTFTEVGATTGARGAPTGNPNYFGHGMGSDWGDYDNDGDLDLIVGNLSHPDERALVSNRSLILENKVNEGNLFVDKTQNIRLMNLEMNAGAAWIDFDNDGYLDIVHCQYAYYQLGGGKPKYTRFYRNRGENFLYLLEDKTWQWGAYIHGAWSPVRIDYNRDGKMDILVASSNENVKLFRNQIDPAGNFINIRVKGKPETNVNYTGYRSNVIISVQNKEIIRHIPGTVLNARASQSTNDLHFGLGDIESIDAVVVNFSDGTELLFDNLKINKTYEINYDGEVKEIKPTAQSSIEYNKYKSKVFDVYPNPANNEITIEYHSNSVNQIRITHNNLLGNEISVIYDGFSELGKNIVTQKLPQIPTGTYIIMYSNGSNIHTQKLIITD